MSDEYRCWAADRVFKYDLSLAPGEMYALVKEARCRLADYPDSKVPSNAAPREMLLFVAMASILCEVHTCATQTSSWSPS